MRKFIILLAISVVVFLCGCSQPGKPAPSAELQKNAAMSSMKSIMKNWNSLSSMYKIVDVKVDESRLKYVIHPSVKMNIGGVQVDAWPMKVEGGGRIVYVGGVMPPYGKWRYNIDASYTLYIYTNNVGENEMKVEDVITQGRKV